MSETLGPAPGTGEVEAAEAAIERVHRLQAGLARQGRQPKV